MSYTVIRKLMYCALALIIIYLGQSLLGEDIYPALKWWGMMLGIGLLFLPLSGLLCSSLSDRGYLFSKTIGLALSSYGIWFFSSIKLFAFRPIYCFISLLLWGGLNWGLYLYKKRKQFTSFMDDTATTNISNNTCFEVQLGKDNQRFPYTILKKKPMNVLDIIVLEELLFLAIFLLFLYIKGFKPEAYGTEKFMDYGFMTTLMRSDYMPAQDFWFSGSKLNYYYVGQFIAVYLTKITGVGTELGYNLMLMMIAALSFMLPFSLGFNIMSYFGRNSSKKFSLLPYIAGGLSGAGVCLGGTMHYPIFRWFVPWFSKYFIEQEWTKKYWFPNATRYIGYMPETKDKTIHEFPSYSFILGDLHAHVINIVFVLTVLGILLAWLYRRNEIEQPQSTIREILQPNLILLGFFIGLFHMTNYWDFPIYYVVSGAIILFSNLLVYNFKWKALWITGLQGIFIFGLGKIISLPFALQFIKMSADPMLTVYQTPFYQLVVLWGLPVSVFIGFMIHLLTSLTTVKKAKLFTVQWMKDMNSSDLFILVIGLCAVGLILVPEIIYIKDIYSGDYKRANTMFKLTYQAFIMLGVALGYIFVRSFYLKKKYHYKVFLLIAFGFFVLTLGYSVNGVNAWFGNITKTENYKGLDATLYMEEKFTSDVLAIRWLNKYVRGTPVVLEANGDSYSKYQRVSVLTGLPTVLGWYTHENLWRSKVNVPDSEVLEILNKRAADIEEIYTSSDEDRVRALIDEYKIEYIYVGNLEDVKYSNINHDLLKDIGTVVFEAPMDKEEYDTYIVKVRK